MPAKTRPKLLLVQGSFQLPVVYSRLVRALEDRGFSVSFPALPSLTDPDKADFTSKTLSDDAAAIKNELERLVREQGKTVVVLMHSYGGLVGNEAVTQDLSFQERRAKGEPGGVLHLFMIAAFILKKGQSVLGVFGESPNNNVKDGRFHIKNAAGTIYHDLPPVEAQLWESRIIDQSYAVQTTEMTNTAYSYIHSTYVVCKQDKAVPPQFQESFAQLAKSRIITIQAGHSPMLSKCEELVSIFEKRMEEVESNT